MKNSQSGFIPLLVALIAALSIGGGVWAYKSYENKKEIKTENEAKEQEDSASLAVDSQTKIEDKDRGGYGEDYPDEFGDDGYEDEDE
jgi:uncharacterized protein HemX